MFETERDVLTWYEQQPRALTKEFVATIPWQDVKKYPIDDRFLPVLVYMRDIEKSTQVYYDQMIKTPTGRDPVIRRFMDKWSTEEDQHATLIDRFLNEAGYPTSPRWYEELKARVPKAYWRRKAIEPRITNLFGKRFSAVHMTWGAINEMSTLAGYQRLWTLARHPVLEKFLRGIGQEEAVHSSFYWNVAKLQLQQSGYARGLTNFMIKKFWAPVGTGIKTPGESNLVIQTLFGPDRAAQFEKQVSRRLQLLPGLEDLTAPLERVSAAAGF